MKVWLWSLAIVMSGAALAAQGPATRQVEWTSVGGDPGNAKASSLSDINSDTVQQLKVAWTWNHGEGPLAEYRTVPGNFETTPLMIDGVLYVTTPYNNVAALDATTGRELWRFDSEAYKMGQIPGTGFKHRGAAVWRDGNRVRVFLNSRTKLYALDGATGKPIPSFGTGGWTSLTRGFPGGKVTEEQVTQGSPPVIYKDLVIVAHAVPDAYQLQRDAPGIVQAFNVRTGKLAWVFNIIPQAPDDFGADTWGNESWRFTGHANVWAPMTVDAQRGLLYLPTSTPSSDSYGGRRPGANLLAESLVCVDAATGKRKWYFQMVHHGLWDYDNPSAPNLVTITVDGKRIDAVVQVTKQGFAFVFDRVTGAPVWPIEERPVPTDSDVPGEQVYPTQPFPTRPPPFTPQGVRLEDANDLTPEIHALAIEEMQKYRIGPLFTPPSLGGTLKRPTSTGGANWGGAAFDAATGYLFVRAQNNVTIERVGKNDGSSKNVDVEYSNQFANRGRGSRLNGIPIVKGPYATLTAIDLNKGEIAWQKPVGEGSPGIRDNPLLKDVTLPDRLGSDSKGGAIVTASGLIFLGGGDKYIYAFDKMTGREVWRGELPYANAATPMTYRSRSGEQFIVVATGSGPENALVAFSLGPGSTASRH
ncbi:MAG TPA: PQQ-binding-like beta-propeller repeat protein [Vicinamibacterales bacterium]|nr:PQQ-binding-like beta-propeller repeat protein [Vicinamibacterales bacterium]